MNYTVTSMREFAAALSASRQQPVGSRKTIVFTPGDYFLTQPILLNEQDTGLTICGKDGVMLSGGCQLTDWQRSDRYLWATVPQGIEPRLLLVNGTSRKRARFPAEGILENLNHPENLQWMSSTKGGWNRPLTHAELTHMSVTPGDLPPDMDVTNAEVTVYHIWDESTVRVKAYDRTTGLMEFRTATGHPAGAFHRQGYAIWNTREGLTQPGQWYFDRPTGRVVYYPLPGEEAMVLMAWIPQIDAAIRIERSRDIEISNLRITLCNSPAQAVGLRAIDATGAVEARNVENLRLNALCITDIVGSAIKLIGCRNLTVDHCQVRQAGANGIFTHECENEIITHNTIEAIGRISFSAIGIHCGWKSMLVYVQDGCPREKGMVHLAHNTICDVPYCGITCNGGPHRIEYNRLSQCMTTLHDGAAIYCSRGDRTILQGNYVFDIDCENGYAYYFDEQSRHCVMEGNLAVNIPNPVHNHMSEHLSVCRNVFISRKTCTIRMVRSRYAAWRHNVVISDGNIVFKYGNGQNPNPVLIGVTATPLRDIFGFTGCIAFSRFGKVWANDCEIPVNDDLRQTDPMIEIDDCGKITVALGSPVWAMNVILPDGRYAGADAPDPEPILVMS